MIDKIESFLSRHPLVVFAVIFILMIVEVNV